MAKNTSSLFIRRTSMFNAINGVGKALTAVGIDPFKLDAGAIINKARKKAGFYDPLPGQVDVGLYKMIESFNRKPGLNSFGRLAVKKLLERSLYGRLKIEQVLAENPEIEKLEIKEPVFIVGLPRTGTTILHAMMHEDPAHRSPLAWECLLPYPVPNPETFNNNHQLKTVRKEFEQLFKLIPDFQLKHYMEADSPQECLAINMLDFNSFLISTLMYVPSYMDWFENESDKLETMRFHKRFLRYLQSGGVKSKRWLLKTPVHLMRLDELFAVYPDAHIIITHRDPVKIIPSTGSLLVSVRSVYSDYEDPVRTGLEQLETWSEYFNRFLKSSQRLKNEDRIINLHFEDFVSDQIGTVKKIYDKFGWELTEDTLTRFQAFLDENPRDKNGIHIYRPEDFGLTDELINSKFKSYLEFLKTF